MQKEAVLYIFRTLVSIFRLEGQKILRVFFFGLIFLGSTFLGSEFFWFFSKVEGLLRLYCPLPPKRGGPCTYYILVHLEQKELFPSMQIICQDSSTVFWQSQRQIFARYTHKNTLYLSLYTQTIHIVFVICILVRKKGERLKEASPNLSLSIDQSLIWLFRRQYNTYQKLIIEN